MIIGQPINRKPTFSGKSAKYIDHLEYVGWYKRDSNGKVTPCVYNAVFEPGYEYCFDFVIAFKSDVNLNYKLVSDFNAIGFEVVADNVDVYGSNEGNYPYCEISCKYKYAKYPAYDSESLYAVVDDSFYISARNATVITTRIASGKVHTGETVVIVTPDGTVKRVNVYQIEMFRKLLDEAIKGDSCGIAFARSDISPSEIPKGSVILADNGTIIPFAPAGSKISGAFGMLASGGTTVESISSGSTVSISNGSVSYTGKIYSSNGEDFQQNTEVAAYLVIDSPVPIYNSQKLSITYGSQYIGDFVVDTLVKVTDFNITKRTYECKLPDAKVKIEAQFTPANATYGVKWESLNPDIATVDSLGNVKAHAVGTVVIRATLGDKVIDCTVNVSCSHFFRYRHDAKASTCTEHGYTEYYSCRYCPATSGKEELPLLDHNYVVKSQDGCIVTYECTECKATYTDKGSNHSYSWQTVGGLQKQICSKCGDTGMVIPFTDLKGFEAYSDYLAYTSVKNSFITGTNPPQYTLFSPKTAITRAMFVTILYRMAGSPYDASNPHKTTPFTDITNTGVYYYNAACWALDCGITTQKTFKPNDLVVREQTATFLFRYAVNQGLVDDSYKEVNLKAYPDYSSVSEWAIPAMQWANQQGMITGTMQGTLNPKGSTLRIHATKIFYGFGTVCGLGEF